MTIERASEARSAGASDLVLRQLRGLAVEPTERRARTERRRLTFWSVLYGGFRPRRRHARRTETAMPVVDWHEAHLFAAAVGIMLLCLVDAILSMMFIMGGARELNPLMDKLIAMGARIVLCDPHRVLVAGPSALRGARVESPDIRAGMAMLLAALGVYSVTAYSVGRRRAEIAIRMALGASARGVVRLVLRRVATLILVDVAIGVALSLWAAKFVGALLFGVESRDPVTLAAAAAVLLSVGLFAAWLPARKVSRLDPTTALRT